MQLMLQERMLRMEPESLLQGGDCFGWPTLCHRRPSRPQECGPFGTERRRVAGGRWLLGREFGEAAPEEGEEGFGGKWESHWMGGGGGGCGIRGRGLGLGAEG